ncbi:MAG: hypothetical protein ABSB25_01375 [Sedimentisphaerales bacterium]|jgi:hypothetical protein
MKWTIEYLEKDGIVAAKINGIMDWEEHRKFAEELYPFARKKGSNRIVIDFREMIPDFTVLQIDDLPKMLKELGVGPDLRIAAVHDLSSPKSNEFTFFKNVATITSLHVEQFSDRNEAIAWLKASAKTEKPATKR